MAEFSSKLCLLIASRQEVSKSFAGLGTSRPSECHACVPYLRAGADIHKGVILPVGSGAIHASGVECLPAEECQEFWKVWLF